MGPIEFGAFKLSPAFLKISPPLGQTEKLPKRRCCDQHAIVEIWLVWEASNPVQFIPKFPQFVEKAFSLFEGRPQGRCFVAAGVGQVRFNLAKLLFGVVDLRFYIVVERGVEQVVVQPLVIQPQKVASKSAPGVGSSSSASSD